MEQTTIERRAFGVELRDNGQGRQLTGYIAVFDSPSDDLGGFIEVVKPGAFQTSLMGSPDIKALFNHDTSLVLGRTPRTLALHEDEKGLAFVLDIPDTTTGRDLTTLVQRGDLSQASFGFTIKAEKWLDRGNELPLREILDVELLEVSVGVCFPAYPASTTILRSLDAIKSNRTRNRQRQQIEILLAAHT